MHNKIYMQYQADGAGGGGGTGTGTPPPTGGNPAPDTGGGNPASLASGAGEQDKPDDGAAQPKTLEELLKDNSLQGELDKLIEGKVTAARQEWDKDAAEQARLAKLSAEDRAKEMEQKLQSDRAAFTREQLVFSASRQLANEKLPSDFAKLLVGKDAAETTANITAFSTAFKVSVEAAVVERLKGSPPQSGGKPDDKAAADAKYKNNPYYGKQI